MRHSHMLIPEVSLGRLHVGSIPLPIIPPVLVEVFLLLLVLEEASPLRRRTRPRTWRLPVNFSLTATVNIAGIFVVRPIALAVSFWGAERNFGIFRWIILPTPAAILLGVVLMDLTFYWWHRANHRFFLLWRFHAVHQEYDTVRYYPTRLLTGQVFGS